MPTRWTVDSAAVVRAVAVVAVPVVVAAASA